MVRAFIPMDDEHCMFVGFESLMLSRGPTTTAFAFPAPYLRDNLLPTRPIGMAAIAWSRCEENDYLIDREEQRSKSYTGIEGIHTQDQAVTESMGGDRRPLVRESRPVRHRGRAQSAHAAEYREAFQKGVRPPSADNPRLYSGVRGGYYTTTEAGDWLTLHKNEVEKLRRAALANA